ncbi:cold-shock protein [Sphingorhabdus sp. Alg239-R122]|uniref:cold-shock protein n=1 Tax=Sphingorhabdus sp. Alg239-R122 TaxID=2305989 RepID=UPI0013DC07AA|nr:cold-shock protein [Sphingorhabdus sp. Alg239-R122]
MGFDRGRRGKGRDKRDQFGDENFDGYQGSGGRFDGGGYNNNSNDRFGGSGGFNSGDSAPRSGFAGGGARGGMPAQVVGEGKGVVKFFNAQKGFGFIQREDGGEDVFVHISSVEKAGLSGLAEGQGLEFTLVDRGGKVSASDLQIDGEVIEAPQRAEPPRRELTGERTSGTVKFFNSMKGFGFITRDDGEADAFVHISAVERSGMSGLDEGDQVEFDVEVDRRGKYSAVNLSPKAG